LESTINTRWQAGRAALEEEEQGKGLARVSERARRERAATLNIHEPVKGAAAAFL
jgi:hypothetical protein